MRLHVGVYIKRSAEYSGRLKIILTTWDVSFEVLFSGEALAAVSTVQHDEGIADDHSLVRNQRDENEWSK